MSANGLHRIRWRRVALARIHRTAASKFARDLVNIQQSIVEEAMGNVGKRPLNNFHSSTTGLRTAVAAHYTACPLIIVIHQRHKLLLILGFICRNSSTLPTDLFNFTQLFPVQLLGFEKAFQLCFSSHLTHLVASASPLFIQK